MSPVDQINPFRKPGPPNPGAEDRGNEPDRSNEPNGEKKITPEGEGYGTSGPEVDYSKEGKVDLDGNGSPDIVLEGVMYM